MKKPLASMMAAILFLLADVAVPQTATAASTEFEPISGAFGIPLGERFEASMVTKLLDESEQVYRGPEGANLKGSLIRVEPFDPDMRFQSYSVKTTADGVIYEIRGNYQYEVEQARGKQVNKVKNSRQLRSTCKDVVKTLAREMEDRHGKPRGKGWDGEWYSFRQVSDTSNRSLRLYGNRCRTGMYSIVYTDNMVLRDVLEGKGQ